MAFSRRIPARRLPLAYFQCESNVLANLMILPGAFI